VRASVFEVERTHTDKCGDGDDGSRDQGSRFADDQRLGDPHGDADRAAAPLAASRFHRPPGHPRRRGGASDVTTVIVFYARPARTSDALRRFALPRHRDDRAFVSLRRALLATMNLASDL
jgi:hypothetical protein